jgi:hypothetical protein
MDTDVYIWSVDPFKGWVNSEKVTSGNVRKVITCLAFSAGGDWLYAGTASGDVITINVQRCAMQVRTEKGVRSMRAMSCSREVE